MAEDREPCVLASERVRLILIRLGVELSLKNYHLDFLQGHNDTAFNKSFFI